MWDELIRWIGALLVGGAGVGTSLAETRYMGELNIKGRLFLLSTIVGLLMITAGEVYNHFVEDRLQRQNQIENKFSTLKEFPIRNLVFEFHVDSKKLSDFPTFSANFNIEAFTPANMKLFAPVVHMLGGVCHDRDSGWVTGGPPTYPFEIEHSDTTLRFIIENPMLYAGPKNPKLRISKISDLAGLDLQVFLVRTGWTGDWRDATFSPSANPLTECEVFAEATFGKQLVLKLIPVYERDDSSCVAVYLPATEALKLSTVSDFRRAGWKYNHFTVDVAEMKNYLEVQ